MHTKMTLKVKLNQRHTSRCPNNKNYVYPSTLKVNILKLSSGVGPSYHIGWCQSYLPLHFTHPVTQKSAQNTNQYCCTRNKNVKTNYALGSHEGKAQRIFGHMAHTISELTLVNLYISVGPWVYSMLMDMYIYIHICIQVVCTLTQMQ